MCAGSLLSGGAISSRGRRAGDQFPGGPNGRPGASGRLPATRHPGYRDRVRYLTDAEVAAAAPDSLALVDLAEDALVALAEGRADVVPKNGVRTAPGMFADAMPAALAERNLLGCKWISIVSDNLLRGLPTASGVMVLNDGVTGVPRAVMTAGELTGLRTAAVSAAVIRGLAIDGPVSYLGAGSQSRTHARALAAVGVRELTVWARRREALLDLVAWAGDHVPDLTIHPSPSREATVRDAAIVISGLTIGLSGMELPASWPREDAVLLPLDYASTVGRELAESAIVAADDVVQYEAIRARGKLGGYPPATTWTGHVLRTGHTGSTRLVVQNLGSAVCDLLIADTIAARAADLGIGIELPT